MKMRKTTGLLICLLALVGFGCDLTPGSKFDWRMSTILWDPIPNNACLAIGTYIMDVDLSSNNARAKASVKIRTQDRNQRDLLPTNLDLRYSINDQFAYQIPFNLNNGKGKVNFILGGLNLSQGDEIDVEACAAGGQVPTMSQFDFRLSYKFDR